MPPALIESIRPAYLPTYDNELGRVDAPSLQHAEKKKPITYLPGRTAIDSCDDSYEHDDLRPSFPKLQWEPLSKVSYHDKGIHGDPQFRNLLASATDVYDYNPKIGTEIHGVNLAKLTDAQKNDLARLISNRCVVFFRNQTDLDVDAQRQLGAYFGKLHKHATTAVPRRAGLEDVHVVFTDGNARDQRAVFSPTFLWHSDVTYEVQPPSYTSLKVISGPPRGGGGDTLWSSQYAAYDLLSKPMQQYLEGLSALHSAQMQADGSRAAGRPVRRDPIITKHPLVRTHPVTGWKSLFFNPGFVTGIVGIPKAESDAIISYLNEIITTTQEIHVRCQWQKNDVAFWDNRICDHLAVNPLRLIPPPDDAPLQLDYEAAWLQLNPSLVIPQQERFTAVKEASALLAVTDPKRYEDCEFEGSGLIPIHRIRNLKVEVPTLRTDHEVDMLNFIHHIEPNLADEFIPYEKVDDEQDEGLGWPSYCHEWSEMYFQKAQNERLEVARDVIAYMKAVLDAGPQNEEPTFEYEWPVHRRNRARDPVTPPLLPRSPTPQAFEPCSETGHLDLLSDRSSPTRQELEKVNRVICEKDAVSSVNKRYDERTSGLETRVQDHNRIGDLYSPLKDIHSAPSPPRPKRHRVAEMKVEGPLTPPASDRPAPWDRKSALVTDVLQQIDPEIHLPISEPEQISAEDIDMLFAEHIAPTAAKAERKIEQEQLQEADTTSRVPVPVMDFSKPKPPWDIAASGGTVEGQNELLRDMKETHLNLPPGRLDGHIQRDLSWKPFPSSLGRYQLQETMEDDGSLASFVAEPEALDLDTLIWKPPGLRILDDIHGSDEEELTYGVFPPAKDVKSLIKKRKFELQNSEVGSGVSGKKKTAGHREVITDGGTQSSETASSREEIQPEDSEVKSDFSAINALDKFLDLRTGKGRKFEKTQEGADAMAPKVSVETSRPQESFVKIAKEPKIPTPVFQFDLLTAQASLVASTTFLSNRTVASRVQRLYPSAIMIERDFALYSLEEPTHQGFRSLEIRAVSGTSMDEADLILSPSTGLILTSLQKVKQQALPGQATRSPVRERIHRIAARYERLIVVVSRVAISADNDSCAMGDLDETDCEALASLTAYLTHLPALGESELLLVDGGVSVLATWIVSLMVKYSSHTSTKLLEEETQWEVFLRQAGMNAFAAQAVLAELKVISEREGGAWGLREFLLMSPRERCRRFEGPLGGRRLLEIVGKVLDAQW
ncbi:MAG: hypothetical protein Q9166_003268 [cf. Caloplaca sp. 2 TL-2023]